MPRAREGVKVLFAEVPVEILFRFAAVASKNRRSLTGETIVALEAYLAVNETEDSRADAERGLQQLNETARRAAKQKQPSAPPKRARKR